MSRWTVNLGAVAVTTLLLAPSVVADDAKAEKGPAVAPATAPAAPVVSEAVVPGTAHVLKIVPRSAVVATAPADTLTVAWDADKRAMTAPTSEATATMAADFARRMGELAAGAHLAQPGRFEQVTLANGAVKARIPADLLSASIVRLDAAGHVYPMCVDGAAEAAVAFATPTVAGPAQQ